MPLQTDHPSGPVLKGKVFANGCSEVLKTFHEQNGCRVELSHMFFVRTQELLNVSLWVRVFEDSALRLCQVELENARSEFARAVEVREQVNTQQLERAGHRPNERQGGAAIFIRKAGDQELPLRGAAVLF
jgi:hypothetical protein